MKAMVEGAATVVKICIKSLDAGVRIENNLAGAEPCYHLR